MNILAIDVGTGTMDIMSYNTNKELENSYKLVLPSPHITICQKIDKIDNDIYLDGYIMGGGKIKAKSIEHINKGYNVAVEKLAGKTIRDDLNQVASYGIEIVEDENDPKYSNYTKISLKDIRLEVLIDYLREYDIDYDFDVLGVAVQDHGYSEDMGDRDFRFEKIREKLNKPLRVEEFGFLKDDVPSYFTRMQSIKDSLEYQVNDKSLIIMDTKFASICGVTYDKYVRDNLNSYIVMDIGNGHTTVASIENNKIQGIYEHHTRELNGEKIDMLNKKLAEGTLKFEDVHNDYGHGAHVINPISRIEKVVVTGPKRKMIEDSESDYYYATPGGDVMMTGTIGLIKTIEYLKDLI